MSDMTRRRLLIAGAAGLAVPGLAPSAIHGMADQNTVPEFKYSLNTSTIRQFDGQGGKPRPLVEQVAVAAQAGFDAIEPWIGDLQEYRDSGGSLADLRKRIADSGLTVESAIGFSTWIVDDDKQRATGLENARQDMQLLLEIGGKRIAAPPVGATEQSNLNLFAAAERYRKLLEIGDQIGITPQLELWGFSKSLSRLGELMFVAVESGHPKACVLPDIYHIYKGGSDFEGLRLINGKSIHCFHLNDFPAQPTRETIGDADRIYPGDGLAPLGKVLHLLGTNGGDCVLSLELFNRSYWKKEPLQVAQTGLAKMREAVKAAFA